MANRNASMLASSHSPSSYRDYLGGDGVLQFLTVLGLLLFSGLFLCLLVRLL